MRVLAILLMSTLLYSCNNQSEDRINEDVINNDASLSEDNGKNRQPVIEFEKTVHNFNEIAIGEKKSWAFKFTNTGNAPLIINNVIASCGCTVARYPKEPIQPGDSEYIKLTFDSTGRKEGKFQKDARVMSNTVPNVNKIYIEGKIVK